MENELGVVQTILGFFGYTKVCKAAVELSLSQEYALEKMAAIFKEKGAKSFADATDHLIGSQKAITKFLRSGRLLT